MKDEKVVDEGPICTCEYYHDPHTCPLKEAVEDDSESLCNCCPGCEQVCKESI